MAVHDQILPNDMLAANEPEAPLSNWVRSIGSRVAGLARTCADTYAAAAAYEDLSRLSDVELRHRGLSRDILARDL
jgi:hypothetical protein